MPSPTTERSLADVLRAAKERISDPERWTTGTEAIDQFGRPVEPTAPGAVAWCMAGAVAAEGVRATSYPAKAASPIGALLNEAVDHQGVGPFNDGAEHDEVLAALDRAIELAEAEQA